MAASFQFQKKKQVFVGEAKAERKKKKDGDASVFFFFLESAIWRKEARYIWIPLLMAPLTIWQAIAASAVHVCEGRRKGKRKCSNYENKTMRTTRRGKKKTKRVYKLVQIWTLRL